MFSENDIDEEALCMLVNNFEEFTHLLPKSGIRMKIKFIIKRFGQPSHKQLAEVLLCICILSLYVRTKYVASAW